MTPRFLLALAFLCTIDPVSAPAAIPPADVFINVSAARMKGPHTLELTFLHPECARRESLGTEIYLAGKPNEYRFGLLERRTEEGQPTCTGKVVRQRLSVDLRALIDDAAVTRGVVHLNEESLYGYMKSLPTLSVAFDFAAGPKR
jgi:hypothetical protein